MARGNTLSRGARGSARGPVEAAIWRTRLIGVVILVVLAAAMYGLPKATASNGIPPGTGITYLPGQTPMNAAYSKGVTKSGLQCGPGVLQVNWSNYAPPCEPAWHGNNGGATFNGVTPTTITVTYRLAASSILPELYLLVPKDVVGTNDEAVHTIQAYINTFNKSYELYGRHVILKTFEGQGDFIHEDLGLDAAQAEADAVNVATNLHAFADISLVDSSITYTEDLQSNKVVAFGLYAATTSHYQQNQPWQFSPGPSCSKSADAIAALYGKHLKGVPTQFAQGDQLGKQTVIGVTYPSQPGGIECYHYLQGALAHYGVNIKVAAGLIFNIATYPSDAQTTVAQMKQAGVNTVICFLCDPILPRYMFSSATQENFYPQWNIVSTFASNVIATDPWIRIFAHQGEDDPQMADIVTEGPGPTPLATSEGMLAYNMGNPDPGVPPIPSFYVVYNTVLQLFDGLQLAGPNLTPQNFEVGMRAIPQSLPDGMYAGWNGAYGPFDPESTFIYQHYDPSASSIADGKPGGFQYCDSGAEYLYVQNDPNMPTGKPLVCGNPPAGIFRKPGTQGLPGGTASKPATTSTTVKGAP